MSIITASVIMAALLGVLVGLMARAKGRDFFLWWLYGTVLFAVALVHVMLIRPRSANERLAATTRRSCPRCHEMIRTDAPLCRYCGLEFKEARAA